MKFCKKCQTETERNADGRCKVCRKASSGVWNTENREKIKMSSAAYYKANTDKMKAKSKAYSAANKDTQNAKNAAWKKDNICKVRGYKRKWEKANYEKIKLTKTAYRKANPELSRIYAHNRRAKKRANGGVLSSDLSSKLFKLQRGKCACCGKPLGDDYHLDHRMPLALGGVNEDRNMQLLTSTCNLQKNAKHPIDFMQSRGFLL